MYMFRSFGLTRRQFERFQLSLANPSNCYTGTYIALLYILTHNSNASTPEFFKYLSVF